MNSRTLGTALCALVLVSAGRQSGPRRDCADPPPLATQPAIDAAARQAGAGVAWWQTVSAAIERAEYEASPTATGLAAPNRAHDLRTEFRAGGIEVVPRSGEASAPAWRFAWTTSGIGRPGQMVDTAPSAPLARGARVIYERDGWTEWYENTAKGLEQGFTVGRRPAGAGPLRIAGTVPSSLRPLVREGAVDFVDANGACVLRYAELRAWDAAGRDLPSRLEVEGNELALLVEDGGARYPLTVDPLMTSPAWTAESDQDYSSFGYSVATAGDVNGDGFSDVIVGAYAYNNGQSDEGRALVYHGSAAGLAIDPAWTGEGNQELALFGSAVGTAGDVNADGYSDIIVGARYDSNGQAAEGRAFVYHGSSNGLDASPAWSAESNQTDAWFGTSVATAGDVNGDGFSDVIIGAPYFDVGPLDRAGKAFVYHGSPTGLAAVAAWTVAGDQWHAALGWSAAGAGDVNSDGYADVIVGVTPLGRALVFHGSPAGLAAAPAWVGEGNQANSGFGIAVSGAGDVNGDGFSDVIVGAPTYANGELDEGKSFVYHGSPAGLALSPAWSAESNQASANFGTSVAMAGDVNGDGFSDAIVGAYNYTNGEGSEGKVFVYLGSGAGLATSPDWTAESNQVQPWFGHAVGTAGDVNGDGFSDVIVGAPLFDNGQVDEGQAFVYHGSAAGLSAPAAWSAESDQTASRYGYSVQSAGDVNGDGYSDVVVGAYSYDNGQADEGRAFAYLGSAAGLGTSPSWTAESNQASAWFGISVAGAGDVNGDGFSDVIVGASGHDNGEADEGRAYVYYGSPPGLGANPAWTAEPNQAGADFGILVGSAGDVNGDGISDVLIGADAYDNGQADEGCAFVYHGSLSGPGVAPAWTAEGNQASAGFGYAAGTAGDVNADGFSDVIAGAGYHDNGETNEGRVSIHYGSAAGLASAPAWTAESNQSDAHFGIAVGTAGDVNGDGFSDVIIGADRGANGDAGEGLAFVFHGAALGLDFAWMAESNQAFSNFGIAVGTAGDVNGDGFSDVIVGADAFDNGHTDEGRAFVYHGSAAGLATAPAWTAERDQDHARFGGAVGTAGDVNGDGFSDVLVGAYRYASGPSDRGGAFVYYGNSGDGLDRIPRQVRTDNGAPIHILGISNATTGVGLAALGRTPAGRDRVRLVWEVKPLGVPFDGSGLVAGPWRNTGVPAPGSGSAVPLSEIASGLSAETPYRWRVRIASASPFFPRSPWLWLPGNGASESDLRTNRAIAVSEEPAAPAPGALLEAGVPNPFAIATRIAYTLPPRANGQHRVTVYDVAGRQVALLAAGPRPAGRHAVQWNGRDARGNPVPAGTYFVRLEVGGASETRKLTLAR